MQFQSAVVHDVRSHATSPVLARAIVAIDHVPSDKLGTQLHAVYQTDCYKPKLAASLLDAGLANRVCLYRNYHSQLIERDVCTWHQ